MLARAERGDQLRLLALLAECLGAKGLRGYQPPSENFADLQEEEAGRVRDGGSEDRQAQVLAFVQAAGGEAG